MIRSREGRAPPSSAGERTSPMKKNNDVLFVGLAVAALVVAAALFWLS